MRRIALHRLAWYHHERIAWPVLGNTPPPSVRWFTIGRDGKPLSELDRRKDLWHARMYVKFERAALYPWLPLAPDPSEPKLRQA
jgi:hypothetical protein